MDMTTGDGIHQTHFKVTDLSCNQPDNLLSPAKPHSVLQSPSTPSHVPIRIRPGICRPGNGGRWTWLQHCPDAISPFLITLTPDRYESTTNANLPCTVLSILTGYWIWHLASKTIMILILLWRGIFNIQTYLHLACLPTSLPTTSMVPLRDANSRISALKSPLCQVIPRSSIISVFLNHQLIRRALSWLFLNEAMRRTFLELCLFGRDLKTTDQKMTSSYIVATEASIPVPLWPLLTDSLESLWHCPIEMATPQCLKSNQNFATS